MSKSKQRPSGLAERPSAAFKPKRRSRATSGVHILEISITPAQKKLIECAAAQAGKSLPSFTLDCIEAEARRLVGGHEPVVLSPKYAGSFAQSLLRPPKPNKALREAARRYRYRSRIAVD